MGRIAFAWRIILTTGTGCIFGFLVGRNALDSALLAPLFIALSLVMGGAVLALFLGLLERWGLTLLSDSLVSSLRRLFVWFLLALAYFSIVHHVTNLYVAEHHAVERYVLLEQLSGIFWLGHVVIGLILPLFILYYPTHKLNAMRRLMLSAFFILLGGFTLLYIIIIGSQSVPQSLFPGKTILNSQFGDAGYPAYSPSVWELGLGLGGAGLALLLGLLILRILPLAPVPGDQQSVARQ